MEPNLGPIVTKRKTGAEKFRSAATELDFTLLDFWQWEASDLVSNTNRGRLAEFIVARALGMGKTDMRHEWDEVDLRTEANIKIEVKSAAYIQTWYQKQLSPIGFIVPPKLGWDPETNILEKTPQHHADVYVFALLHHREKQTINPMAGGPPLKSDFSYSPQNEGGHPCAFCKGGLTTGSHSAS
jgi:hypothetical protein